MQSHLKSGTMLAAEIEAIMLLESDTNPVRLPERSLTYASNRDYETLVESTQDVKGDNSTLNLCRELYSEVGVISSKQIETFGNVIWLKRENLANSCSILRLALNSHFYPKKRAAEPL